MLTAAQVLAANNFGDTRTGGLAGPMGLFLIVLLAIATVLLIRNMNSRLRRLPHRFPDQDRTKAADRVDSGISDHSVSSAGKESTGSAPSAVDLHGSGHSTP